MTEKELREIKRRFRPDKNNILSVRGCRVNSEKRLHLIRVELIL